MQNTTDILAAALIVTAGLLPAPVHHTPLLANGLVHNDHAPSSAVCGSDAECAAYDAAITSNIL